MHKRITITLVWLIIVFIAMFGVYRFEKPKKFKLPLLRGEVVGAAPDFSAIHDIAERKEAFNYLKPGVRYENSRILQERTLLKRIKRILPTVSSHLTIWHKHNIWQLRILWH